LAVELPVLRSRFAEYLPTTEIRHASAGAICALVSLVFTLSYAALIFSGPLTPWLSQGLAATFVTATVGATIMALRSSLGFSLASPDSSTCAVSAALAAALVGHLVAAGAGAHLLVPALVTLALSAGLAGLLLCVLGLTHAGRMIRFVPYPVIGGFLGSTGWLITAGAVQVITGHPVTLTGLDAFLAPTTAAQLAAGVVVAAVLILAKPRFRGAFALPLELLACTLALYAVLLLFGIPLGEARAEGWMFIAPKALSVALPWTMSELDQVPWGYLPWLAADVFAVMFVTAVSMLLNLSALELVSRQEADLDRELNALGLANLASAALGGFVNGMPLSRSTLSYNLAGTSRIPGFMVALSSAAMLVVDPFFLGYIPKCVLGGLLLSLGYDMLKKWLVESYRQISRLEYASLIAIAAIIIKWGFVPGVLIGIVIGCATFAFSASRVDVIKFSFDGSEYRSSLDRGLGELAVLRQHGREIQGLSLQSYLFFGSANYLYEHVKSLLTAHPHCRFLIFDLRLVTGVDSSAAHSFIQIKRAADRCGAQLVLVNINKELMRSFRGMGLLSKDVAVEADVDHALESCENALIKLHSQQANEAGSLRDWLAQALGNGEYADVLARECRRVNFRAGDVITRQHAPADCMHFILEGRVDVKVETEDGTAIRVRSLGRYTTIGEMGLITRQPRSASIHAETECVLYELPVEAFDRLTREQPLLVQALLRYAIGLMAERLSFASRLIAVLQR